MEEAVRILVCAKEVSGKDTRYETDSDSKWIREDNISFEMSECDEYALEEALQLKEKHGGEVVLISVGNSRAEKVMRKGLAMGADRGILILDDSRTLNSPASISSAISSVLREESFDLILTGTQSDDLGFAQTGVMLAEKLSIPHATLVMEINLDPDQRKAEILQEMENGIFQKIGLSLPCLLTIQAGISSIRYPSLKGIMQAKKKEIKKVGAEDLQLDLNSIPRLEILDIYEPKIDHTAEVLEGSTDEVVAELIVKLRKEARVL
jgi:electron transfer flavoprotein beta subunit